MKKDWLEKQIFENKAELNTRKAPADMWNKIENRLDNKGKKREVLMMSIYKIAAVLLGVVATGAFVAKIYFQNSMMGLDPSYATAINMAEEHYSHQVEDKIEDAKKQNIYNPNIASDIEQLDKVYKELKEEMLSKKGVNNNRIMNEMVKNYKLRISLLEDLVDKRNQTVLDLEQMKKDTI
jgi:hypothetical protein